MASKDSTAKAATNVVEMKKPAAKKTTASTAKAVKATPKKASKKTVKKAAPKTAKTKTVTQKAAPKATAKPAAKKKAAVKKVALKAPKKATAKKPKIAVKTKAKAKIKPRTKATVKVTAKPSVNTKTQTQKATHTHAMPDMTKLLNMETLMPTQNFKFDQISQDATKATRESTEAFTQSSAIFAKGFEAIMKTAAAMTQSSMEKQAQYMQEIMGSKTLNEAAEAQSKIAKESYDEFMSSATTLSEMSVKLLNDSAAPLNEQMTKAMAAAQKMAA